MANEVVILRKSIEVEVFRAGRLYEKDNGDIYLSAHGDVGVVHLFRLSDGARWGAYDMGNMCVAGKGFRRTTDPVTITPKAD